MSLEQQLLERNPSESSGGSVTKSNLPKPLDNTATTSGSLNLLYAAGSKPPAETGLKVASNGRITFAAGQPFPGTGTATSVGLSAPSSDFTVSGSPVTHSGTLALNWTVPPTSADTTSAIVKRDGTGSFSAGTISAVGVQATSEGQAVIGTMTLSQDNIAAVTGAATASGDSGFTFGVLGTSASNQGRGVVGQASGNAAVGVIGEIVSGGTGIAVQGKALPGSNGTGVWGESDAAAGANGFGPDGVDGISHNGGGSGVFAFNDSTGDALAAANQSGGFAAFFNGDVDVDGNLSKAAGSFKIDDPVDPANKYLFHSFVESPDIMNIYNGNVVTDTEGNAVIMLPDWFEALNRDFRYQLTVVGQFSQAIVASKVANHQFSIKTDKPNVEVSWPRTRC
jgi:trimeric autotransporter adhesin